MWISEIEIENIRCFAGKHRINLSKGINLLVGPNNSGKSTIINCLLQLQYASILSDSDITSIDEIYGLPASINFELRDYESIYFGLPVDLNLVCNMEKLQIVIPFVGRSPFKGATKKIIYYDNNENGIEKDFNKIDEVEPNNFIYPFLSKRKVLSIYNNVDEGSANRVETSLANLTAIVDKLLNRSHFGHKQFIESIENILNLPLTTYAKGNGKKIGLYNSEKTELSISIEKMGEGIPNVLGLLANLFSARKKLFLIEEPENDLHPKALKELCKLIIESSENNQFIISTHSNIVLKYLGAKHDTKIFHIKTHKDEEIPNFKVSTVNEVLNNKDAKIEILEDLGYEFHDYDHWAAWLFLEESSAEELIRDYFIDWFAPKLKGKLRTYSARSVGEVKSKFKDFNNLFVFIHLESVYKNKAWVIVDNGEDEKKIINSLKENYVTKHNWIEDRFKQFQVHSFEEFYPIMFKEKIEAALNKEGNEKRNAKSSLLHEVKDWIKNNPETAKIEFEKSAKEVIDILREIETEVTKNL